MKFWSRLRILILGVIVTLGIVFFGYNGVKENFLVNPLNNPDSKENKASSKMNYGRFLDYVDMGWVKTVDFYNNGRIAIIEASSPELGDRPQRIRVEIPIGASSLISKLKDSKVDFASHPTVNLQPLFTGLSNIIIPLSIGLGLFFLFRRSSGGFMGGPGEIMNFRKAKIKVDVAANTGVYFDMVAGIDEAKEEFEEVVSFLQTPERFTSVGAEIPKGVILVGPPGTGKTLLAKAIAGEAGVPFISISGSEFVEMFVGVGASRVRDLFKTAKKNAPCIVFIDEIDAVGRQRGAGVGGGNDEREQTLNQILTEMDGFRGNAGVIVIAATNRVDVLDSALLRPGRFNRQVAVNLPDIKGRKEILEVHARDKDLSDISLETIAQRTPGFSGADLANLLNEAAILTARRNKEKIGPDEINSALDRIIAGLEGQTLTDTKNKRLIAYHEIGHAIVGTLLRYHDKVEKVTLVPRGQARGLTWFTPNENQMLVSRGQLLARIIGTLGGRAAEEVIFGATEVTTGASNDIQQVTNIIRQMVTRFGMSSFGPMFIDSGAGEPVFLGRGIQIRTEISDSTLDEIDNQVKEIVQYCYQEALNIICENRVSIDQLVELLIEKETISGDELIECISRYTEVPIKSYVPMKLDTTLSQEELVLA